MTLPDAEKYILQADALRRRQLESALVHGSEQTWRERRRIWPATIGGVIAVVVVVAVVAIVGAFDRQREITQRRERELEQQRQPRPTATMSTKGRHRGGEHTAARLDGGQFGTAALGPAPMSASRPAVEAVRISLQPS